VLRALQRRWPGLLLCSVIAVAANAVAQLHNGPPLLYALLFGLSFNFLAADPQVRPGVDACGRSLLRLGVVLLGARITLAQIVGLGAVTAGIVAAAVLSTVLAGVLLARALGMGRDQGLLSGGATAICGASAALAIAAVLPRSREQERFTLVTVVTIASLSTVAMVVHPLIVHAAALPPRLAGLFIGGTIHDVAQVIGAGYALGPAVGDQATLVKLLRISLLAVLVLGLGLLPSARRAAPADGPRPPLVPGFLLGFVALAGVHSAGWLPALWTPIFNEASRWAFTVAIAALGVRSPWRAVLQAGWRVFTLLLAETLWLTGFVFAAAWALR
jgi:uncharacterized integral membrane protein (TIGR00698 family)